MQRHALVQCFLDGARQLEARGKAQQHAVLGAHDREIIQLDGVSVGRRAREQQPAEREQPGDGLPGPLPTTMDRREAKQRRSVLLQQGVEEAVVHRHGG